MPLSRLDLLNKVSKRIKSVRSIHRYVLNTARRMSSRLVEIEVLRAAVMGKRVDGPRANERQRRPSSASFGPHTESEAMIRGRYWPLRARRRHCPGVMPILSVNTRRNDVTD